MVRPCISVRPLTAEVLGKATSGEPVLLRHAVGRGVVYFLTDPIELGSDAASEAGRRQLYAAFLKAAGVEPLRVQPDEPWLHAMAQPTVRGTIHVVYSRRAEEGTQEVRLPTAAGEVALATRNRWPALCAVTRDGKAVAVNAYGTAAIGEEPLMGGRGLKALLSLDGRDLRRSEAILVAPFEQGQIDLPRRPGRFVAAFGEFRNGGWTTLERLPLGELSLAIDEDRATCLILLCKKSAEARWAARLTDALRHPERIEGY
jgi:hypothetical protein